MALITLVEFKTYMQITDTTYDALYSTYIEAVSADVEEMANQYFDLTYAVNTALNSQYLSGSIPQYDVFEGMTVTGAGIPERAVVQSATLYQIVINKFATAGATGITATYNAVPEQIKPVIANMVMYKIINNIYTAGGDIKDLKSEGIGSVSLSYGDGAAIDSTWGYPRNLVKSIRKIRRIKVDIGKLRLRGTDITNERINRTDRYYRT